jgi:hypothetical protein
LPRLPDLNQANTRPHRYAMGAFYICAQENKDSPDKRVTMRLGKYNVPRKEKTMRTQKLPSQPVPELTNKQFAGRTFLFFAGCAAAFRGIIWLGDTFY